MKRRYIAYALIIISLIIAVLEIWDVNQRIDKCIDSINKIDESVRQGNYSGAYEVCEEIDRSFVNSDSGVMFCYYKHDELEKIDTKIIIMSQYLKQKDKVNYLASSSEVIKMLTVLKEREQISIKNIL